MLEALPGLKRDDSLAVYRESEGALAASDWGKNPDPGSTINGAYLLPLAFFPFGPLLLCDQSRSIMQELTSRSGPVRGESFCPTFSLSREKSS